MISLALASATLGIGIGLLRILPFLEEKGVVPFFPNVIDFLVLVIAGIFFLYLTFKLYREKLLWEKDDYNWE